jgi:multicomponent Na+:H+ antiporter subunit G
MTIIEILASIALALGAFFSVVGVLGIIRMPDVYSRIHAAGIVSTLGILGLLAGATLLMPEIALRAAALGLFLVLTSPVSAPTGRASPAPTRSGMILGQVQTRARMRRRTTDLSGDGASPPRASPAPRIVVGDHGARDAGARRSGILGPSI